MRILLTGASGQVGRALHEPLQSLGTVLAPNRTAFDLSRPDHLPPILDSLSPDVIINPAAYTAVDRAEDEVELAFRINAEAPQILARWAGAHRVPIVHFSTDYVFDGSGQKPWCEDDPTGPLSVYGASKLAGETAICEIDGVHLIVRTSWVFSSTGANFLNTILRFARERAELRIVSDQFGAPTSARSIAKSVISILHRDATTTELRRAEIVQRFSLAQGLLHVSNAGETSWHGFACAIVEGLRAHGIPLAVRNIVPIETKDYPTKAKRPLNSRLDLTRLDRQFGVQMPDWREALARELADLAIQTSATADKS
jgi:dTDP-4-dehydrorhamnose reductase